MIETLVALLAFVLTRGIPDSMRSGVNVWTGVCVRARASERAQWNVL